MVHFYQSSIQYSSSISLWLWLWAKAVIVLCLIKRAIDKQTTSNTSLLILLHFCCLFPVENNKLTQNEVKRNEISIWIACQVVKMKLKNHDLANEYSIKFYSAQLNSVYEMLCTVYCFHSFHLECARARVLSIMLRGSDSFIRCC